GGRLCAAGAPGSGNRSVSAARGEAIMLKRLAGWRSAAYRDTTSVLSVRDVCEQPRYAAASAGTLPDTEALLNLKPALRRSLSTQFGVEGLAARLCPVELEDGSAAIFAL